MSTTAHGTNSRTPQPDSSRGLAFGPKTAQYQRAGRYLPESAKHPGKIPPDRARHIIESYSSSGDLVVDPMAAIGSTIVEGASIGRVA